MGLYPVAVCYNVKQGNTIQYSTVEYNIITHITPQTHNTQDNPRCAKLQYQTKNTYYTLLRLRNE